MGPPTPSPASECVPPRNQRGGDTLALRVRGWGGSQFGRLEKKPSTLSSLCAKLTINRSTLYQSVGKEFYFRDAAHTREYGIGKGLRFYSCRLLAPSHQSQLVRAPSLPLSNSFFSLCSLPMPKQGRGGMEINKTIAKKVWGIFKYTLPRGISYLINPSIARATISI